MESQIKSNGNFTQEEPPHSKIKLIPESIKKKRKLKELQHLNNDQLSASEDDVFSDIDLSLMPINDTGAAKLKKMHHKRNKAAAKKEMSLSDRCKLAKAQLHYITRENEMLCNEWASTEKVLKKLKTERKVLLDALVKKRNKITV